MKTYFLFFPLCILIAACTANKIQPTPQDLVSLRIVDQNGFSESINSKDRLSHYKNIDFTRPQPYQKVLSVYGKNPDGTTPSCIISYYSNGQPRQYITAINNRAFGEYKEWYPNGMCKLEVSVIGGTADLSPSAEKSWVFDGISRAFDEEGQLIAEIPYSKGDLDGVSKYYYECGSLWQSIPFRKNKMDGEALVYFKDGTISEHFYCIQGKKEGSSESFWHNQLKKSHEYFKNGLLITGAYYDLEGNTLCSVIEGNGSRAVFHEDFSYQIEEIKNGSLEGSIKLYAHNGFLKQQYHVKDNQKYGEELFFEIDPESCTQRKKLSLYWEGNSIQGTVRTWYNNGNLESQRELCNNKKNGTGTAWYNDGSLLLIEEYNQDILINGEYFKKGELFPISRVINGKGVATLYNSEGIFLRKVIYNEGKPVT